MSPQEGFPDGECVLDKNNKQKYKVISKEMGKQMVVGSLEAREYHSRTGRYHIPEYEYTLENAKTREKDYKPHSDLKSCYIGKKIEKGDCVKKSMFAPGYIVKSISPDFKLTLMNKKTEEELTEPESIEEYYHCSMKNSKSNNQDPNTEKDQLRKMGGAKKNRKTKSKRKANRKTKSKKMTKKKRKSAKKGKKTKKR